MDFPPHEHDALRDRLRKGLDIVTTRTGREMGSYWAGQLVRTPFGWLKVTSTERISSVGQHPCNSALTPSEREFLATAGPMDVIRLAPV